MTDKPMTTTHHWTKETILEALHAHRDELRAMGVTKLGLFGSYARGEQRPDSDMDFVTVIEKPTFDAYFDVKFFLQDLFGVEIDLGEESVIKPRLRPYIMKEVAYVEGL